MTFRDAPQETETPAAGPFGVPPEYFGPPDGETALRADEMHATRVETEAMSALRTALHHPETGFASRPPTERLAALPELQATLDGIGETFRAQATTPRQRAILGPLLDNHLEHAATQVGRLAEQALVEADDGIVETRIGHLQQDAAVNWDDPARLRILGRAIVTERRSQGERKSWDKDETEARVRHNVSDFYATAIEAGLDKDLDRAGKLLTDAQGVLLPEQQSMLARKLAEAREDRHVAGIAGTLAAIPLDPAAPPNPKAYRTRAEELTPDDALPELRTRIAILADTAQRHATKYWQHDRNQAGLAAIDWMVSNPGAPLVTMDRKIAAQLSPDQRARLQEIETTGRLDTDPEVYDRLDRLAVYDPKAFAATDLSQYRLALDGQDYRRFTAFQRGDATFARYDRGRTVLDAGLIKANLDPDGAEARAARGELDKTLRSFEAIEGRPPATADIDRIVRGIVAETTLQSAFTSDAGTPKVGDDASADNDGPALPRDPILSGDQRDDAIESGNGHDELAQTADFPPGTPLESDAGKPVILPDGSRIVDPNGSSSSGYIMSPVADLSPIAAAGQRAGKLYRGMMADPRNKANAINVLLLNLFTNVGTGGAFDYQREGNQIVGHLTQFKQLRQFRDVSNINVGLYCQQAGLTLEETLREAGGYARQFSSNARADQPYGLHRFQKQFITMGFEIGQSGIYDKDRRQ